MEIYQDWNPLMKFILNGIKILFSRVTSIIWVLNLNVETLYVWFVNFDLLNQKVFLMENNKLLLYIIKIYNNNNLLLDYYQLRNYKRRR